MFFLFKKVSNAQKNVVNTEKLTFPKKSFQKNVAIYAHMVFVQELFQTKTLSYTPTCFSSQKVLHRTCSATTNSCFPKTFSISSPNSSKIIFYFYSPSHNILLSHVFHIFLFFLQFFTCFF